MKQSYDKQAIAQLLSRFMAGETSVAEEAALAQYFRTHEVGSEWAEYKEMFALFDNGQVDIEPEAVPEKPKIKTLRWLALGIAASIALLVVFHLGRSTAEQSPVVAEQKEVPVDSGQSEPDVILPVDRTVEAAVAQAETAKPQAPRAKPAPAAAPKSGAASAAENLADCIARLEAEMNDLDDSVNSAQVERLIAADVRLQQMVSRIVGKQVEQAMNKIQNDSTANYVSF